ncbi:MAG: fluoride efflux transporter CrcB [Campylobacterales bacterium]|nr:fluoride efflux transporter CrcB [Campylobacterales bacterium]
MTGLVAVGIGGALGAISRYLVVDLSSKVFGTSFPYGTLIVNSLGSFLLLFLLTIVLSKLEPTSAVRLFIAVGFMGSFTTFSSFSYETITLFHEGLFGKTVMNIIFNNILAIGFGVAGLYVGRYFTN